MRLLPVATAFLPSLFGFLSPLSYNTPSRRIFTNINPLYLSANIEDLIPEGEEVSLKDISTSSQTSSSTSSSSFDLATALFCGGLAFDSYVEPPANSSRWERGSRGVQVAFLSNAYTRQLYQGLVEIQVRRCTGLPEDDSATERLLSGNGVDACVLVAAVEGSWKEDIELLEKEQYNEGVWALSGAAHVGRSRTAWANTDQRTAELVKKRTGKPSPYHIPGGWGRGGQAVWPEDEDPFYLYVQDPATVRLVFTILDADRVGNGKVVASTFKRLTELVPQAALSHDQLMVKFKEAVMEQVRKGELDVLDETTKIQLGACTWQGELKMTSKPRKKDKNGQMLMGAAAGAAIAGPAGAAAGALLAGFYEGEVAGRIELRLRYLPIPQMNVPRKTYQVLGGMPGINWGSLYERYRSRQNLPSHSPLAVDDLEHCFFVNHANTGATCAVYRSLEKKLIVVSFRGTCAPIDLLTDASIVQDAWVEGEDMKDPNIAKVHTGFRNSMNSISRRLKELILACPAPGEDIADYDMLVTGHSLGGALATLFIADIGQYGIDAGRALPQLEPSEPWWKSIANTFMGQNARESSAATGPPRPRSLRLYNFGSPRVGNQAFADLFDALCAEGFIDHAFRIVNGEDVVARLPRTVNALVFGSVGYEHIGSTVLISQPNMDEEVENVPLLWIEGESDSNQCPVRDGVALTSPMAEGTLLADLIQATRNTVDEADSTKSSFSWESLQAAAVKVTERIQKITAMDVASVLGIDRSFTERELKIVQSIFQGKALAHHMEDQYYSGMGRASGFLVCVGEEIQELEM